MHVDLWLFHIANGMCGNWFLDRIAAYEENDYFFKGGIFLTLYWWFWFANEQDRRVHNRRIIISAICGSILALALNRALAGALPFRVRPMYAADIGYHAPSIEFPMNLERWSSFPSDSATFWFALSFGLFRLRQSLGIVAMVYSSFWMCLARLYLGIHYPSDLLAGALLGVTTVWAIDRRLARPSMFANRMMDRIFAAEADHPQLFYAAAFMVSFELTMMFNDVRNLVRGAMHVLRAVGYLDLGEGAALFILAGVGLLVCAVIALAFTLRRHWHRFLMREPGHPL